MLSLTLGLVLLVGIALAVWLCDECRRSWHRFRELIAWKDIGLKPPRRARRR